MSNQHRLIDAARSPCSYSNAALSCQESYINILSNSDAVEEKIVIKYVYLSPWVAV